MKIKKKMHLLWNHLRLKEKIPELKSQTQQILKQIMENYLMWKNNAKEATLKLFEEVRDHYYEFIRAHNMTGILKEHFTEMMVSQIIRRY